MQGSFPPGGFFKFAGMANHLLNMFRGHAAAYKAIKAMPGASSAPTARHQNYFP